MRRLLFRIVILAALTVVCGLAVAEEHADDPFAGSPFRAEMSTQILISPFSLYASVNPSVGVKWGWFAAGVGTKLYAGLSQQDLYLAPYLRIDLLWFYLAGGYSFPLLRPDGFFPAPIDPFVTAGFSMTPLPFAWGQLGFDLTLEVIATATRYDPAGLPLTTFIEFLFNYVLARIKAGAGLTYRFPL